MRIFKHWDYPKAIRPDIAIPQAVKSENTWSIPTWGKLFYLFAGLELIILWALLYWFETDGAVYTFVIFVVPFFLYLIFHLPRRKVPLQIQLSERTQKVTFTFSKKKSKTTPYDQLAICYWSYKRYSVLEIFMKFKATRGHYVYKPFFSVVGLSYGLGWTKDKLWSVTRHLLVHGVEWHSASDTTLLDRLVE